MHHAICDLVTHAESILYLDVVVWLQSGLVSPGASNLDTRKCEGQEHVGKDSIVACRADATASYMPPR